MDFIFAMHMADALVSPQVGLAMLALGVLLLLFSAKKSAEKFDELNIPLMGVLGAFIFAGQMVNFAIPMTGSSGHISGGILLAAMLGAYPAFIALSCVLIIQALFFADGGLLSLGCNIFNLAFFACLIAYPLIFVPIVRRLRSNFGIFLASILSCVAALQLGAFCVVLETLCSGVSELGFGAFLLAMQPIHLAIGLVEGILTGWVIALLKDARPELFDGLKRGKFCPNKRQSVLAISIAAFIIAAGLSQVASEKPDGLEWSIAKTSASAPEAPDTRAHSASAKIQEKTAVLPDYSLANSESAAGTSLSGVAGGFMCVALIFASAALIRFARRA